MKLLTKNVTHRGGKLVSGRVLISITDNHLLVAFSSASSDSCGSFGTTRSASLLIKSDGPMTASCSGGFFISSGSNVAKASTLIG